MTERDEMLNVIVAQLSEARDNADFWNKQVHELEEAIYALTHPDNEQAQTASRHTLKEIKRQIKDKQS